jgi:hypothetical protein
MGHVFIQLALVETPGRKPPIVDHLDCDNHLRYIPMLSESTNMNLNDVFNDPPRPHEGIVMALTHAA